MYHCVWFLCPYPYGLSLSGSLALLWIANNRHGVTITTHAIKCHFLIWMTTVKQPTKHRRSFVLTLKYSLICIYWWTRQRIHNTLIVVDRYLRIMGIKRFQTRRSLVWNRFIPYSSQVSIYHIEVLWILIICPSYYKLLIYLGQLSYDIENIAPARNLDFVQLFNWQKNIHISPLQVRYGIYHTCLIVSRECGSCLWIALGRFMFW